MDLLQLRWKNMRTLFRQSFFLGGALLLVACASVPSEAPDKVASQPESKQVDKEIKEQEKVATLPLNSELVYYILTAELAGQRGEIGLADELYNKADKSVDSPSLAARSAQVANYTRDKKRINRALNRWLEVDPDNAEVYIKRAPYLMMQGDFDAVIKSVNKALSLAPDKSQRILAQIADNLSELAKPEQALGVLQKLDLYQQHDPGALFIYARLAEFYKHYDSALEAVNDVLTQQSGRENAQILKATILQRLGKSNEALAFLKTPASKKTATDDLRFAYAKLLGENGKTEQARQLLDQLHAKLPKNQEILFALGLLALDEKDGEMAKAYFSQLLSMGDPSKQAAYFMGLSEELEKNTDAALIWFASVPIDSSRFHAAQTRYINLLADNGQLEKARLHLKLLRKEQPDNKVQYYSFEGSFLRERGYKQAAFDLYTEALVAHPNNSELLYGRAMVAESLKRLAIFEQDLKKILKSEPNNATVLNALGYTLADRTNRYQEALALIKHAVELSPKDSYYLDSLGWVYYKLGDLDKAATYLKQAVAIKADVEFLAHLGEVLWQQGKHAEAKRVWQRGLTLKSNDALLIETMHRLGQ